MDALKSRLYDDAFVGEEENSEEQKNLNIEEETLQLSTVAPSLQHYGNHREKNPPDDGEGKNESKDHDRFIQKYGIKIPYKGFLM